MLNSKQPSSFKKLLPYLLLAVMAIASIAIRNYNKKVEEKEPRVRNKETSGSAPKVSFGRTPAKLFFTKHARCRMACRKITQQEIREILLTGTINYNKSDLSNPERATYALEGNTKDGQRVRVIFAPKKQHTSVVTVIDLGVEHPCNCS